MKLDPTRLIGPLVAALMLVLIFQQTLGALHVAGVWGRHANGATGTPRRFGLLEDHLTAFAAIRVPVARDPFAFGAAPRPAPRRAPAVAAPAPAPEAPERPVLTSIVWVESNPSATVRWHGRDYTIQANSLFDEFRVQSITREQVTLLRGDETLVLKLNPKGD